MPSSSTPTENESPYATPDERAKYIRALDIMGNKFLTKAQRVGVNLSVATEIVNDLEHYTRLPSPKMPELAAALTEQEIVDMVVKVSRASGSRSSDAKVPQPSQAERDVVQMFSLWRVAVFTIESKNAFRVEMLFYAARILSSVTKDFPAHKEDFATLEAFAKAEWGLPLTPVLSWSDARRFAPVVACDLVACPSYLRTMSDTAVVPKRKRGEMTRIQGSWMSTFDGGDQ